MSKEQKKQVRAAFRTAVFTRDKYTCRGCNLQVPAVLAEGALDAHHITPRTDLPNGGYVKENGVTLCKAPGGCHEKAEDFFSKGETLPTFTPEALYKAIGSSREEAEKASRKL